MQTGAVEMVSVSSSGQIGNAAPFQLESSLPSISADGRYVAFRSNAANFANVPFGSTNVFVHDRTTGTTTLASTSTAGDPANNGGAGAPTISADGRYIEFESAASNLVSGVDPNEQNVYVKDLQTGDVTLANVRTDGTTPTFAQGGMVWYASMSGDGNIVAFVAHAAVAEGVYAPGAQAGVFDLYTHNLTTSVTTFIASLSGSTPMLSYTGQYIEFNNGDDILVADTQAGTLTEASVAPNGATPNGSPQDAALPEGISADGRYVLFTTDDPDFGPVGGAFIRDLQTGTTTLMAGTPLGAPGAGIGAAGLSPDGNVVAVASELQFDPSASYPRRPGALQLEQPLCGAWARPGHGDAVAGHRVGGGGRFEYRDRRSRGRVWLAHARPANRVPGAGVGVCDGVVLDRRHRRMFIHLPRPHRARHRPDHWLLRHERGRDLRRGRFAVRDSVDDMDSAVSRRRNLRQGGVVDDRARCGGGARQGHLFGAGGR
jgi:WD40-like Beta Propeller Repeat